MPPNPFSVRVKCSDEGSEVSVRACTDGTTRMRAVLRRVPRQTLDVHVKRLRSKLEEGSSQPSRIVTIRGLGYRYER